ncbi:MAG: type I DNA topoisomerase [Bacteroidetes bacterium]|nr:type I DNA topoisomerase [Bacteroidota bacterium]
MPKSLVIVESPTKAKTISKYLGKDYIIESSAGHIKNLPERKLGINVDSGYTPEYETIKGKADVIKKIKDAAKKADQVFLATDPDREGEAIAWHLAKEVGKPDSSIHRVLFHEITRDAVIESISNPIRIDDKLVEAQQARRVMDRIVGYQVSPFLWKAIYRGLSAGRVQTAALRLLCEREKEISAFETKEYWSFTGLFKTQTSPAFPAKLFKIDQQAPDIPDEAAASRLNDAILAQSYQIGSVETREVRRNPGAPFITSTLQQDASNRLRFSTKKTMSVAQQLYEGVELDSGEVVGLITYMRTDSVRVSEQAIQAVRSHIATAYGVEYLPKSPRQYKTKKSAQDAHEAIRPTSLNLDPKSVKKSLTADQFKLYELIWNRFVASQMESARFDQTTVDITGGPFQFRATGRVTRFSGFLAVYGDVATEKDSEPDDQNTENGSLPAGLTSGQRTQLTGLTPKQNFTKPPARYTEASLVSELESKAIGRPSTYSSIISTLIDRKYAELKERKFQATEIGMNVYDILVTSFPDLFSYDFTARMEEFLDEIAEGKKQYKAVLDGFYLPLQKQLEGLKKEVTSIRQQMTESSDVICDKCGSPMIIRWGKNGKFLACSNFPACKNTRSLTEPTAAETPKEEPEYIGRACPTCQNPLVKRKGRFGLFIACSTYPVCKYTERIEAPADSLMPCPSCGKGTVREKKSRKGKIFYGCDNYPACDFALWDKPVPGACPSCGHGYRLLKRSKTGDQILCPQCQSSEPAPA